MTELTLVDDQVGDEFSVETADVIVVSGSNYSERALEARLAGAYDYVRKDRLTDDLVEAIIAAAHLIKRGGEGREERGCGDIA